MVFFPAFKLQDDLRIATLGVENWKKLMAQFDSNEKKIAGFLNKAPAPLADRLDELNEWVLEEKASAMAKKSSRSSSSRRRVKK